jgi:hypothetical protein
MKPGSWLIAPLLLFACLSWAQTSSDSSSLNQVPARDQAQRHHAHPADKHQAHSAERHTAHPADRHKPHAAKRNAAHPTDRHHKDHASPEPGSSL